MTTRPAATGGTVPLDKARQLRRDEATPNPQGHLPELRGQCVADWQGRAIAEREWIAVDWIPRHQVTLLMGDSGIGKTTVALQLAAAVALGKPWLGTETTRCPVLAILCEDEPDENQRRMRDVAALYGVNFRDLADLEVLVPEEDDDECEDTSLMSFDQFNGEGKTSLYYHRILRRAQWIGAKLIILDTLADFFSGDENKRRHVFQFMTLMKRLARAIDGAVVICGHPSRAGMSQGTGESGSTHWKARARSFLYLERTKDEDGLPSTTRRTLTRLKSNYAAAGEAIRLEWDRGAYTPEGGNADFVDRLDRAARQKHLRDAFLFALRKLSAQGRNVSHSRQAANYAPKVMQGLPEFEGFGRNDIETAMKSLFDDGLIEANAVVGRKPNRLPLYGIAEVEHGDE